MRIGIPKEIKAQEGRVALNPAACSELVRHGHRVLVQAGAGAGCGFTDAAYEAAGAELVQGAARVYGQAELLLKVKEPQDPEYELLRPDHLLFCFLHLAAAPELARALCRIGLTAVGFETVDEQGALPILAPMSRIAGRIAGQVGAHLLHAPQGGKGLLLGALPGAPRGRVVVLGGGSAGAAAAAVAAGMGAEVVAFDKKAPVLAQMQALGANVSARYPFPQDLEAAVREADLLIGAVLLPGARAPHLVSREMVQCMERGGVVVDVSVDQGGCVATTRPTTYDDPTYVQEGVVHFSVTNMPGAVPRTATHALSAVLVPYVLELAREGWRERSAALAAGINVRAGERVHPALAGLESEV